MSTLCIRTPRATGRRGSAGALRRRHLFAVTVCATVLAAVFAGLAVPTPAHAAVATAIDGRPGVARFSRAALLRANGPIQPGAEDAESGAPEWFWGRTFTTPELRVGQGLEQFPFPIMTEPPHSFHDPVADLEGGFRGWGTLSRTFTLPSITSHLGLYGRFWLSPRPRTSTTRLVGVEMVNASWHGVADNSIVVFSVLDRTTQDNAVGTVSGATQGIAGQLVGVLFERSSSSIVLRFENPVLASHRRFVLVVDTENLPTGRTDTIYPDSITVARIRWLWSR